MGTRFEIALAGDDPVALRAAGEAALAEIEDRHRRWSAFSASSMVTRINREAGERAVAVDRETLDLLLLAHDVWDASGGAFDITVGPLMRRLGFRDGQMMASADASAVVEGPPVVGMDRVVVDERTSTVWFVDGADARGHAIEIDLGAIAKGWALDVAADVLRDAGVTCALLHGGTSTVIAIGAPPEAEGWAIKVRPPHGQHSDDPADAPVVHLRDAALAVSAPHGRTISRGDVTLGHVIDPRTGQPTTGACCAAVIADRAAVADAWSTALLVLAGRPATIPASATSAICSPDGTWSIDGPHAVPMQRSRSMSAHTNSQLRSSRPITIESTSARKSIA